MFGLGKKKPIAEHEAEGDIERVYHEIKQVLRVSGINLNFRTWATHSGFLPLMWDAIRANLETRAFEEAADQIRAQAAAAAEQLGRPDVLSHVRLGESQMFQLRAALDLYHYINPKLLLITSTVKLVLAGAAAGSGSPSEDVERIERGIPPNMAAMEMEEDDPDNPLVEELYRDIQDTLGLKQINSDYRTLALWPDYFSAAWQQLKPIVQCDNYRKLTTMLREYSYGLAATLPYSVTVSRKSVTVSGADVDKVVESTDQFEQLLPGLIINIALLERDWHDHLALARSPFPARALRE